MSVVGRGTVTYQPESKVDEIEHPPHYKHNGIECIDVIEAWNLGFNLGNVLKYIARQYDKGGGPITNLKKAQWYLNREIANLEKVVTKDPAKDTK